MTKIKRLESQIKEERAKEIYATFYSPGTLFSESSSKKLRSLSISQALKFMKTVKERHGATPYGFRFEDGNGKSLSGFYYVTGTIKKYDDIPPDSDQILRSNMRCNNYPIIIENTNSYRFTNYFNEEDNVIGWDGKVMINGKDPELVEYRKAFGKSVT